MSTKEISAWAMALGVVVISGWVARDLVATGAPADVTAGAWSMLWAIGASIVFNIVVVIVGTILVSIAQGEAVKDERSDERDKLINGKSMAAAYFALSISLLGILIWLAMGLASNLVPHVLFAASMIAGGTFAVSQIVLYRVS